MKAIFFSLFLIFSTVSFGQPEGRMLSIGYEFGYERLSPAFLVKQFNSDSIVTSTIDDRFFPKQVRIMYGRYEDGAFFEFDLTGMLYYLADYTYYLATKKHMNGYGIGKLKKQDIVALDASIMNMDLGFGGNVKFGPHFDIFAVGPERYTDPVTNTSSHRVTEKGLFALGFGVYAFPDEELNFRIVPSYLTNKEAKGFELAVESGIMAGPLFGGVTYRFRSINNETLIYLPVMRSNYFGIKAGVMLGGM